MFTDTTRWPLLDFLCPVLLLQPRSTRVHGWLSHIPSRRLERSVHSDPVIPPPLVEVASSHLLDLPKSCPGCGAYAQCSDSQEPGFYSSHSKSVKSYLGRYGNIPGSHLRESELFKQTVVATNIDVRSQLGLDHEINSKLGKNSSRPLGIYSK